MARFTFVIIAFVTISADVFLQLAERIANVSVFLRIPTLMAALGVAVTIGAAAAHTLLSVVQGTNVLEDIIQEEPVEQLI